MMPSDFKTLNVWQEAHKLSVALYRLSSTFPENEKYNLTSQLRRAGTSIELNISEGCGKRTDKDFISFLYTALGSTKEVENILLLAKDVDLINSDEFNTHNQNICVVGKMLTRLIQARQKKV